MNPVLPEATLMVCAQVVGNDAAVAWAGAAGNFELNVMQPVIARNVLESIRLLARSTGLLATRCVDGITVDRVRLRRHAEASTAIATPLNRVLGYDATAAVVKRAQSEGITVRESVLRQGHVERGEISADELETLLDVDEMTHP